MKRLPLSILFGILFLSLAACSLFQPSRWTARESTPTVSAEGPTASSSLPGIATLETESGTPDKAGSSDPSAQPSATPQPDLTGPSAPDVANYAIDVQLDPKHYQLSGQETIVYQNSGQKPMPDLVFHLYLNGFKSEDTIFMRESGGQLRGVPFIPEYAGWIEVESLKLKDGSTLKLELEEDGTLARVVLPQPVAPGEQVTLELSFKAQLPKVFARTGWALDKSDAPFFLVGQWFPKLGVWTDQGWNAYPFHGNAEFFSDFGDYDVAVTVPGDFITGATGMPVETKKNADGTQTVRYAARGVIDFAWVASPNLQTTAQKVSLPGGGETEVVYYYLPEHDWSIPRVLGSAVEAVKYFSDWYGDYPYKRLSVIDVPEDGAGAGGMEYPTFITAGASGNERFTQPSNGWVDSLAITTVHEAAHQWFQSMLATNEGEEPWLDEGFADYSTVRYMIAVYGLDTKAMDAGDFQPGFLEGRRSRYVLQPDLPMFGKAWDFKSWSDYGTAVYAKPDLALMTLERTLGEPVMLKILKRYTTEYRFKHPTTEDFKQVVSQYAGGTNLDWFWNGLVYDDQELNYVAKAIQGDSITVARKGDLVIPTEIEVTFADGSRQQVTWDGKDPEKTFRFDKTSPVTSFEIDPQHKLIIELNWKDNDLKK